MDYFLPYLRILPWKPQTKVIFNFIIMVVPGLPKHSLSKWSNGKPAPKQSPDIYAESFLLRAVGLGTWFASKYKRIADHLPTSTR